MYFNSRCTVSDHVSTVIVDIDHGSKLSFWDCSIIEIGNDYRGFPKANRSTWTRRKTSFSKLSYNLGFWRRSISSSRRFLDEMMMIILHNTTVKLYGTCSITGIIQLYCSVVTWNSPILLNQWSLKCIIWWIKIRGRQRPVFSFDEVWNVCF